jgi:hypothetical protein
MNDSAPDRFTPPYISFAQLQGVLERMVNEGVPSRIDRSYLSSWSGSSQAQFLKAARSLDLLDEHGHPTEFLKILVSEPSQRPRLIGDVLQEKYADALALDKSATQQQLDEVFRGYGTSGATTRKAVTFFLHAAKFAGIELSPFFTAPRGAGAPRTGTAGRRRRSTSRSSDHDPPPAQDAKQRYIDLLLKKAEGEETLDDKLLDRIERVIGVQAPEEA